MNYIIYTIVLINMNMQCDHSNENPLGNTFVAQLIVCVTQYGSNV